MPELNMSRLEGYLSSLYKENVRISSIRLIGKETGKKGDTDLKGFGYGIPYIISFSVNNNKRNNCEDYSNYYQKNK